MPDPADRRDHETDVRAAKAALRADATAWRAAVSRELGAAGIAAAAAAALAAFRAHVPIHPDAIVSGYWPMVEEFDCRPLLRALHGEGHACALPVVAARRAPLTFRRWTPEMPLRQAGFGLLEPPEEAPALRPDLLLVPLLAVDAAGYRLGYGGGFYDRTLATLRAEPPRPLAVGLAFQAQRVAAVPREATDQPLDWLVTEAGVERFNGNGAAS